MIRFAVIGTNWITKEFIDAAHESGKMKLCAVYSRTLKQATEFAKEYKVKSVYDSLEELAKSDCDAVYIASPNSFHYQQAMLMLSYKKHVICEKPLAPTAREVKSLMVCAKKNRVVLFEAFKTTYIPNFIRIWQLLPELGQIRKVSFNFCKYSSRYPAYLEGKNPNTFNPEMAGGSIMDIGYYCVASMIALFGDPEKIKANATLLESGVDAHGTVIADYGDFDVVIIHSKVSNSYIPSEIQGEKATITIDQLSNCVGVKLIRNGEPPEDISLPLYENTMRYEAEAFAELVHHNQVEHVGIDASLSVAQLLGKIRRITGVVFPMR